MICEAPAHPLEPPAWHFSNPSDGSESVLMGLVSFGTPDQTMKLGDAAEKSGLNCSLLKSKDGRSEVMVLFNQTTTREAAFAFYQRVSKGEFGTTDTGLMVLPASAISKK